MLECTLPRSRSQMGNNRNEPPRPNGARAAAGAENPNESIIIVHLFCAGRTDKNFHRGISFFSRSDRLRKSPKEKRKRAFCRADMRRAGKIVELLELKLREIERAFQTPRQGAFHFKLLQQTTTTADRCRGLPLAHLPIGLSQFFP